MTTRATRGQRRRSVVLLAVILAVIGAFVFRLVDIQVVQASDHIAEGVNDGNLGTTRTIAGARGDITDANGTVLASSVLVYDAQLDPKLIQDFEEGKYPRQQPGLGWAEASERIAGIVGKSGDEVRELVAQELEKDPDSRYVELANGLSTQEYLDLRDLIVDEGMVYIATASRSVRVYPNGAVAGTAIGFLNGAGKAQYGVERMQDECLAAQNGEVSYLRGQGGIKIPGSERITPAVDGGTVQLTINSDLNWYLQQMIAEETKKQGAKAGTVTVVDVKSGKIRAMAEYPSVDPNDINSVKPKYWMSQIFADGYEPGSTFKPITAASVINEGAATPLTSVTAPDHKTFPNGAGTINDAFKHPVYRYTFAGALIDSSNVALSQLGTLIPKEKRYEYLQKFGVGTRTAVDFHAEQKGILNDPGKWGARGLYTTTFGQAFTVTPAQIAGAYQALANDGRKLDLSLVESCTTPDGTVIKADKPKSEQVVTAETAKTVRRMLENVAVQGNLAKTVEVPGYRIGIKTGTAQKPDGKGGYKKGGVYFTNMAGIAPIEDPQFVVLVTLDEPTRIRNSGATAVAFQKAMTQVLKTYRVTPSSQPMDELLPKFD